MHVILLVFFFLKKKTICEYLGVTVDYWVYLYFSQPHYRGHIHPPPTQNQNNHHGLNPLLEYVVPQQYLPQNMGSLC